MKTILIVEDTDLNIVLLTHLLEDDHQLLIANDGAQGASTAKEKKRFDADAYFIASARWL